MIEDVMLSIKTLNDSQWLNQMYLRYKNMKYLFL